MAIVEFVNVSKTYLYKGKAINAVNNLNFSVDAGEAFGFVGANGAGKSTTIKILLDFIRDYQGEVLLRGISARDAISRKGVGYVPESPVFHDELSPLEVLLFSLKIQNFKVDDPSAYCLGLLERLDIASVARKRVRYLSKGMVQRTAIAHALVGDPKLLILDEPLSGLDPVGRREVVDLLADYKMAGGALFFTSHVLHDVERLADRFGLISKGELKTVDSPSSIIANDEQSCLLRVFSTRAIEGMIFTGDNLWQVECPSNQLWQYVDIVKKEGARIVEVKPSLNLEAIFMRYVN